MAGRHDRFEEGGGAAFEALRLARPDPPLLSPGVADAILVRALADAERPGHRFAWRWTWALAPAAIVVATLLLKGLPARDAMQLQTGNVVKSAGPAQISPAIKRTEPVAARVKTQRIVADAPAETAGQRRHHRRTASRLAHSGVRSASPRQPSLPEQVVLVEAGLEEPTPEPPVYIALSSGPEPGSAATDTIQRDSAGNTVRNSCLVTGPEEPGRKPGQVSVTISWPATAETGRREQSP